MSRQDMTYTPIEFTLQHLATLLGGFEMFALNRRQGLLCKYMIVISNDKLGKLSLGKLRGLFFCRADEY